MAVEKQMSAVLGKDFCMRNAPNKDFEVILLLESQPFKGE